MFKKIIEKFKTPELGLMILSYIFFFLGIFCWPLVNCSCVVINFLKILILVYTIFSFIDLLNKVLEKV